MANIDHHAPGSFCWIELGTTDQNAAKQFYGTLFGWKPNDFPMGPGEVYTMFQIDGRNAGAAFGLNAQMLQQGVPPHWMPYVCVTSADETAAKASQSGGTVMAGPFDVMNFGRMAVIKDPAGAVLSIWEPKTHPGTGITGVPGTMCWADLSTPDAAGASEFYKNLFGWGLMAGDNGYLHIKNGEDFIGGIPPAAHRNANAPPHWLTYFTVDDCDSSTDKAKASGANVYVGPMTIEKVGRMTVLADPQGAVFALFQALPRE
jgi:predicted enzyme related to lactoylglutathione lyase